MLVYHYYPVAAGGAEHQCRLQARALVEQGHACRVLTVRSRCSHPAHEQDHGVSIFRINTLQILLSFWIDFKARKRNRAVIKPRPQKDGGQSGGKQSDSGGMISAVVKWINALCYMAGTGWHVWRNKGTIDVLHTHVASWNAGFATWLGARLGIPVICKASYLPAFDDFRQSVPFAKTWNYWRKRATFVALTDAMADDIAGNGVSRERIHVIPNGVTVSGDVHNTCGKQVLYVGNFTQGSHHKGFDTLLLAWDVVHKSVSDARLVIAGGGDASPWKRLVVELGCSESVDFAGHVADLKSLYLASSLFVLPSRGEGISNALLEAQSYGLPAVVSDIPGNRAVVVHGNNGVVVPVEDKHALALGIIKLLEDEELRYEMSRQARQTIVDRFSIERVSKRYVELYQKF